MLLLYALALYAVAGLVVGLAFVTSGVTQVQPAGLSAGARILIFPGAALLWPYIVMRWRKARSAS